MKGWLAAPAVFSAGAAPMPGGVWTCARRGPLERNAPAEPAVIRKSRRDTMMKILSSRLIPASIMAGDKTPGLRRDGSGEGRSQRRVMLAGMCISSAAILEVERRLIDQVPMAADRSEGR